MADDGSTLEMCRSVKTLRGLIPLFSVGECLNTRRFKFEEGELIVFRKKKTAKTMVSLNRIVTHAVQDGTFLIIAKTFRRPPGWYVPHTRSERENWYIVFDPKTIKNHTFSEEFLRFSEKPR